MHNSFVTQTAKTGSYSLGGVKRDCIERYVPRGEGQKTIYRFRVLSHPGGRSCSAFKKLQISCTGLLLSVLFGISGSILF